MKSSLVRPGPGLTVSTGALAALALGAALGSCRGRVGSADVLGDSAYVEVMAELASLGWRFSSPRDSLARDSARFATLRKHGVTVEDLERFAERRGSDPQSMASLWQIIAARADELAGEANRGSVDQLQAPDSSGTRRQ